MNKHFKIVRWEDSSVGCGFELFYRGEYIGTSGSIMLLRKWARKMWKNPKFTEFTEPACPR